MQLFADFLAFWCRLTHVQARFHGLMRLNADITNRAFLAYTMIRMRFSSQRKLKILFSENKDWKDQIKKGFELTRHEIEFGEFSADSVKNYDLLVPLTIRDSKYLSQQPQLKDSNPLPLPDSNCIHLCDDKYLLNQKLIALGFGDFVPLMGHSLPYPFILKKRIDEWGRNSHIISNEQQLNGLSHLLTSQDYFLQEFITGRREYATHILFDGQSILSSINIQYLFESDTPIKGKDSAICKKICGCTYIELFGSILKSIGFAGLCCVNYKVRGKRPFIFEINPRFGGSLSPYFFAFLRHVNQAGNAKPSKALPRHNAKVPPG